MGAEGRAQRLRLTFRRWERCTLVVETSVQLGEWEQHPPDDPSLFGRLSGRALGALAQPC